VESLELKTIDDENTISKMSAWGLADQMLGGAISVRNSVKPVILARAERVKEGSLTSKVRDTQPEMGFSEPRYSSGFSRGSRRRSVNRLFPFEIRKQFEHSW
jgi:hypothetical protein